MCFLRKKLKEIEKRVADLEKTQSKPQEVKISPLVVMKSDSKAPLNYEESEKLNQFIDEIINH